MPKRAPSQELIDPVRSRMAAAAAAAVAPRPREASPPTPAPIEHRPRDRDEEEIAEVVGGAGPRPRGPVSRSSHSLRLTINRKIMVSSEEAERIDQVAAVMSAAFGSKVTYSQVSRAFWSIIAGAEDAIRAGARRAPKLTVPSKGDHVAMAHYEQALADFILTALKRS